MRTVFSGAALVAMLATLSPAPVLAEEAWRSLPTTPAHVVPRSKGSVSTDGAAIYYALYGRGRPVVLLHGGFVNSDYLALQAQDLARDHLVIVIDTRAHGRSRDDGRHALSYDLFASDVLAVLDHLRIARADFVGWSDGAITALALAMRAPARARRIFAFGANSSPAGLRPDADKDPVFAAYLSRARAEYPRFDRNPGGFASLEKRLSFMWASQPDWSDDQLRAVRGRIMIADGDHDEAITRSHTEYLARTIPGAQLLILPGSSHFAFLQRPGQFNAAVRKFLDSGTNAVQ